MNNRIPDERFPMSVIDVAEKRAVLFDARGCRNWSNEFGEDWDSWESTYKWIVEETLFLHTGEPHYWTLMEERQHVLSLITDTPTVKRLSDAAAVEWFVNNGIELPVELRQFHEVAVFKPGPAADPQVNAKHATSAVSSITPQWDSETQEQPSDDLSAPATTPVTPPHSTKPVVDGGLAKYQDPLTPLGKRILKVLWNHQYAVPFQTLREQAWEGNDVSESAIERRLQDIDKRWAEAELHDIDLEISPATTSVKLVKPLPKTGDKKGDN